MILVDVNVLVYAHKEGTRDHSRYLDWLESVLGAQDAYGFSELVLSSFLRVVTHPRIFENPSSPEEAFAFAQVIRDQPNAVPVVPGPRHWDIFHGLCRSSAAKGNLIPDAYLAALAIESGCEWVTTDRDFARFPGLKWRAPF